MPSSKSPKLEGRATKFSLTREENKTTQQGQKCVLGLEFQLLVGVRGH